MQTDRIHLALLAMLAALAIAGVLGCTSKAPPIVPLPDAGVAPIECDGVPQQTASPNFSLSVEAGAIAIDDRGLLLIANRTQTRLQIYDRAGQPRAEIEHGEAPIIALTRAQNEGYIGLTNSGALIALRPEGDSAFTTRVLPYRPPEGTRSIAVDRAGGLWTANAESISRFSVSSTTALGPADFTFGQEILSEPVQLILNEAEDQVFVADQKGIAQFSFVDQSFVARTETQPTFALAQDRAKNVFFASDALRVLGFDIPAVEPLENADFLQLAVGSDEDLLAIASENKVEVFSRTGVLGAACALELRATAPPQALFGHPFTVLIERVESTGKIDWSTFNARALVTGTLDGVALGNFETELHNGVGSLSFQLPEGAGQGELVLTVTSGGLSKTLNVQLLSAQSAVAVEGRLEGEALSWKAGALIHVKENVLVPGGETLNIAAGALVKIDEGKRIVVRGQLQIDGTQDAPVYFFPSALDKPWGQIEQLEDDGAIRGSWAFFVAGGGVPWMRPPDRHCCSAMVRAHGGQLQLQRALFADASGKGLLAENTSVALTDPRFHRLGMGAELVDGAAMLDGGHFSTFRGVDDNDALYLSGVSGEDPDIQVSRTILCHGADDGIDTENVSAKLRNFIVYGFADKALALTGRSPVIEDGLVFSSRIGARMDDKFQMVRSEPRFVRVTLVDNAEIGYHNDDRGGADAAADVQPVFEQVIIWNNPTAVRNDFPSSVILMNQSLVSDLSLITGERNEASDPQFMKRALGDYRSARAFSASAGWRGFLP